MGEDRIQYLENAIRIADQQINTLKLNRRVDPNLLDTLSRQRLHFQQELAKLRSVEIKTKQAGFNIFGMMDILDDEEIIKLPTESNDSNKKAS
jgi:hypothetical protein